MDAKDEKTSGKDNAQEIRAELKRLRALCRRALQHAREKLDKRQEEMDDAGRFTWYQQMADSLLASPQQYPRGTTAVQIVNIHTNEPQPITLNAKLDGRENAALLYKKAKKGKRGAEICEQKVAETESEIAALTKCEEQIGQVRHEAAMPDDKLEETAGQIGETLTGLGIALPKPPAASGHARPEEKIPYRHFVIDGWDIFIGKNDAQNDELTVHFTKPSDIWMHVAQYQGSHVVVRRSKEKPWPPDEILRKAASLAVWFSKAKHTSSAEVHVTEARFVRKRHGSPAGQVIAERGKSVRTAPHSPHELFGSDYTEPE
jgi:predicted ribosome quality control (RQC) complex YloA/Tae2 family protein